MPSGSGTRWSDKIIESFVENLKRGEGADNEGADNEGADNEGADNEGADNEGADNEGSNNSETIAAVSPIITNPVNLGNNADELILSGANLKKTDAPEDTPVEKKSLYDHANNLVNKPNLKNLSALYRQTVTSALKTEKPDSKPPKEVEEKKSMFPKKKEGFKEGATDEGQQDYSNKYPTNYWTPYSNTSVRFFGVAPTSEKGAEYSSVIASQWNTWFMAVPMAFVIVINWWYLWNYTSFSVDFRGALDNLPFRWFLEPFLYSLEHINYWMITMRLDTNPRFMIFDPETVRNAFRGLWNWRPVTFCLFYFLVAGGLVFGLPGTVNDMFASVLLGESLFLNACILMFAMYYYVYLTLQPMRYLEYGYSFSILFPIFMILFFVLSVVIAGIMGPAILGAYFYFISYFTLMYFTFPGFNPSIIYWPWRMFREFLRIYHDLSEAPVPNPNTDKLLEQITNFAFQEFHNLVILFLLCVPILAINLNEAVSVFADNWGFMLAVFIMNFAWVFGVSGGMEITIMKMFDIFGNIAKSLFKSNGDMPTVVPE